MASRKVSVEDGFYDASQDLDDIEKRVVSWDADKNNVRTLESIDLFAGKGNFCAQCQDQNYSSMTIDVLEDPVNHDILSKIGFRYILDCLLSVVLGGWATCGPPCGLFVFISSAFHKRSCFLPYGAQALRKIRAANQIIVNLVVLLAVAHSRAVFILIEQPGSSLLWLLPELAELLDILQMTRVHTWMKNFGHKLPKPSVLMLTLIPDLVTPLQGKWSRKMEDAWSRMLTRDLIKMIPIRHLWKNRNKLMKTALKYRASYKHKESKKVFYTKTFSKSKRKVQVTGGKHLAETGVYTPQFCRAVIDVWERAQEHGWGSFTKRPDGDYKSIWARCFRNPPTQEDVKVVDGIDRTMNILAGTINVL